MLNNGNDKQKCPFGDEIVSYMYDEIHGAKRGKFESHLAGCTTCTDEFAGISNARFSVFEWRKEEFAHLPTPEIVIPYEPKTRYAKTVGFFDGLRDLLTLSGWSSAAMVAAALVICIGLGFVAMNYIGLNGQVAGNNKPVVNEQVAPPVVTPRQNEGSVLPSQPAARDLHVGDVMVPVSTKSASSRDVRPERVSVQVRRVRERNLTASRLPEPSIQQKRKAPALTTYDEDDDKSLRLADLFDEGGSTL